MDFKQALAFDIENTFLNLEEFGESINLNGRVMPAVVTAFDVEFDPGANFRTNVSLEGLALHVAETDAPEELRAGRSLLFNGERWFVLSTSRDACLHTIRIYRELS